MVFGLSPEGFTPKSLDDVKAEIENDLQSTFGEEIDLSSQSVFGQIVGIFSLKHSQLWALANDIYINAYPDFASGVSLDRVCSLTGILRAPATASTATVVAYGISGTILPAGQEVLDVANNITYTTDESVSITNTAARDVIISIPAPVVGAYTVTISGIAYTFTASGTPTLNSIVNGLVAAITAGATPTNVNNKLRLRNLNQPFSVVLTANMIFDETGVNVQVTNTVLGAEDVPIGAITGIQTPVSGWLRVTNLVAGNTGRDRETDEELRLRRDLSLEKSIIKAVLEVPNVTQAKIFDNDSDITDGDGTPAHHIWPIVEGGLNNAIAKALIDNNAAGIGMRGLQTGTAISPYTGLTHTANFDRPTYIYPTIVITYSVTEENTFPVSGIQLSKNALVAYGKTLLIGDDLIYSRLFAPIHTVSGLQVNSLTVNAGTASLSIAKSQLVIIRDADITMSVTP